MKNDREFSGMLLGFDDFVSPSSSLFPHIAVSCGVAFASGLLNTSSFV